MSASVKAVLETAMGYAIGSDHEFAERELADLRDARDAVNGLIFAHKECHARLMHDDRQREVICIDPAEWKRITDALRQVEGKA